MSERRTWLQLQRSDPGAHCLEDLGLEASLLEQDPERVDDTPLVQCP